LPLTLQYVIILLNFVHLWKNSAIMISCFAYSVSNSSKPIELKILNTVCSHVCTHDPVASHREEFHVFVIPAYLQCSSLGLVTEACTSHIYSSLKSYEGRRGHRTYTGGKCGIVERWFPIKMILFCWTYSE
jgi:hypothetical protein